MGHLLSICIFKHVYIQMQLFKTSFFLLLATERILLKVTLVAAAEMREACLYFFSKP